MIFLLVYADDQPSSKIITIHSPRILSSGLHDSDLDVSLALMMEIFRSDISFDVCDYSEGTVGKQRKKALLDFTSSHKIASVECIRCPGRSFFVHKNGLGGCSEAELCIGCKGQIRYSISSSQQHHFRSRAPTRAYTSVAGA